MSRFTEMNKEAIEWFKRNCPECDIENMAKYDKFKAYISAITALEQSQWVSVDERLPMYAIGQTVWHMDYSEAEECTITGVKYDNDFEEWLYDVFAIEEGLEGCSEGLLFATKAEAEAAQKGDEQ